MVDLILLERVEKLGQMGQVVKVKPGYARNYLLPQKKAMRATKDNLAYFETQRAQLEANNLERKSEAAEVGEKIEGLTVVLIRQAGESGQLYGSVAMRDIAEAVTKAGFTVDKQQIVLARPIKTLGLHPVRVMLHPEVGVTVTANVAQSEEGARMQAAGIDPLRQIDEEEEAARSEAQSAWASAQAEVEARGDAMSAAAAEIDPSGTDTGRIPVLDIGPYLAGEPGAAAPLARAIARTCEDTGFLVVANHGVPPALVDDTFAVAAQFFARPEADKLALKIGAYNIGYLPFGGQVVRHSPVNKNTKPNFSESFYITRDRAPDHPDIVNNKPLIGLNRWPAGHARVPRRDDGLLRGDGGDDDAAGAGLRAGARTCRPTISPRPSPSRTARSG